MIGTLRSLGLTRPCLPALLIVCLAPAVVSAESIRFQNKTTGTVVVQPSCVIRGVVHQGTPYVLNSGDMTPPIMLPGNKIIIVRDDPRINPTRILYQGTIAAGTDNQSFDIVNDARHPTFVTLKPK